MSASEKLAQLIELRRGYRRPEHMVILSLCGRLALENLVIVVEDHENITDLDVRGLVMLNVQIAHVGKMIKRVSDLVFHVWEATDVQSLSTHNYLTGQIILVGENNEIVNKRAA
jgi:hypothetical protein